MPRKPETDQDEERERIITIREDSIYNYSDVLDKICRRKQPYITKLLRGRQFPNGVYKIRDERIKRMTPERLEILNSERVMWLKLTNEQAREILGTDEPPLEIYKNYLRQLKALLKRHEHAFMNHPLMYLHEIQYIPRPIQQTVW